MEKFLQNLEEADRITKVADHLLYMTYPIVKDKKLLLKILTEINNAVLKNITAILQYEYLYQRISLTKNPKENFQIFQTKCAPRYSITEKEINSIIELVDLTEKHKSSPMEFVKDEKLVILSENMNQKVINVEKIKEFIELAKSLSRKTRNVLLGVN